jgi:hypothetical protein
VGSTRADPLSAGVAVTANEVQEGWTGRLTGPTFSIASRLILFADLIICP